MHNHQVLNYLGVQQWSPRKLKHPWYNNREVIVEILPPTIFGVKCLVLYKENSLNTNDPVVNKILTGMLGVLDLLPGELSIAKIVVANKLMTVQDWQQVLLDVSYLQPKFILQLDNKTMSLCCNYSMIIQTYHPEHLANNPADKAIAYKDLLAMKHRLHDHDY